MEHRLSFGLRRAAIEEVVPPEVEVKARYESALKRVPYFKKWVEEGELYLRQMFGDMGAFPLPSYEGVRETTTLLRNWSWWDDYNLYLPHYVEAGTPGSRRLEMHTIGLVIIDPELRGSRWGWAFYLVQPTPAIKIDKVFPTFVEYYLECVHTVYDDTLWRFLHLYVIPYYFKEKSIADKVYRIQILTEGEKEARISRVVFVEWNVGVSVEGWIIPTAFLIRQDVTGMGQLTYTALSKSFCYHKLNLTDRELVPVLEALGIAEWFLTPQKSDKYEIAFIPGTHRPGQLDPENNYKRNVKRLVTTSVDFMRVQYQKFGKFFLPVVYMSLEEIIRRLDPYLALLERKKITRTTFGVDYNMFRKNMLEFTGDEKFTEAVCGYVLEEIKDRLGALPKEWRKEE